MNELPPWLMPVILAVGMTATIIFSIVAFIRHDILELKSDVKERFDKIEKWILSIEKRLSNREEK